MVKLPPYLPSAKWYYHLLKAAAEGLDCDEALVMANSSLPTTREFARCIIRNPGGSNLMISAAVEGGGRRLRDIRQLPEISLSNHGNWRKTHPAAIEACYGRKPFFSHYAPLLTSIYKDDSTDSLAELNTAFHKILLKQLTGDIKDLSKLNLFFQNSI